MKRFTVENVTASIRRVTFANPPVNLVDAATLSELSRIVDSLSHDEEVTVVVFGSAVPGYFMNHADGDDFPALLAMTGDTGSPIFLDLTTRLATAPLVSIGAIRVRPAVRRA
ncbi:hypothetical protein [Catenuloplanes atrovinosus]|uniref:Enoyl-CoA hydratase/carnithine racemase n=1 Tax=Catenuloplanes atrovinosus TaxID=137266 RepID=A0AAE3YPK0_9ACTN|nr:hypothetical protein [Catenuloplanes atrovinosus]MDR7276302.1 enoyl-CoA hydratase/carnithine racemase [Catenuloplanes atrovinosus]